MKKLFLTLVAVTALTSLTYGQGRVAFNNESTFTTPDAITIGVVNMGAAGGTAGWGIGGDKYSVQLLWAPGTLSQGAFDAAKTNSAAFTGNTVFVANTGPLANFSGFFDAGAVASGGPAGTYTFQVLAWYNVGFSTYAAAVLGGANVGQSTLFQVNVTASPTPINSTVFSGFTVGTPVPEPGTLALAGLGAASLLLFRRKK